MLNAATRVPEAKNEPVLPYAPGGRERAEIREALAAVSREKRELTPVIDGREVRTGKTVDVRPPHKHHQVIATLHQGGGKEVEQAIAAAKKAHGEWAMMPFDHRAAIFLRAADLLSSHAISKEESDIRESNVRQAEASVEEAEAAVDAAKLDVEFTRVMAPVGGRVGRKLEQSRHRQVSLTRVVAERQHAAVVGNVVELLLHACERRAG